MELMNKHSCGGTVIIKYIIAILVLSSLSQSTWACYDRNASDKENIKNCISAAEQGDISAQTMLGVLYSTGAGATQDYKKAAKWSLKAAEQGDIIAQYQMGTLLYAGHGLTQDYKKAAKWYRKAAEQGLPDAQYNLGLMHAYGEGVIQDEVMAHMFWNIAAANGNAKANENRAIISKLMTSSQIEEAQKLAREWIASH